MKMVKRKVAELEGNALDWAVYKAVNVDHMLEMHEAMHGKSPVDDGFHPSTDWAQGGPLIAKYCREIERLGIGHAWRVDAYTPQGDHGECEARTLLVAACRAIVASELGEEVEIPKALERGEG